MSKNEWTVKGLKELKTDLEKLPLLKQASILRSANRKALKNTVEKKLKQAVPWQKRPGAKSKDQVITHAVKGDKVALMTGIAAAYFHYRFLEFGTKKRKTKNYKHKGYSKNIFGKRRSIRVAKKVLNRGTLRVTRPFAERTIEASIKPLLRYLKKEYVTIIKKGLKRANKVKK